MIFAMTIDHLEALLDLVPEVEPRTYLLDSAGGDVADPFGSDHDTYRRTAEIIEAMLNHTRRVGPVMGNSRPRPFDAAIQKRLARILVSDFKTNSFGDTPLLVGLVNFREETPKCPLAEMSVIVVGAGRPVARSVNGIRRRVLALMRIPASYLRLFSTRSVAGSLEMRIPAFHNETGLVVGFCWECRDLSLGFDRGRQAAEGVTWRWRLPR